MRRVRLPLGRRLFLLVATLVALLLTLPLRIVAGALGPDDAGVSARAATGSVWAGRLIETRLLGMPLGDLRAGLRAMPLVAGRARIDVAEESAGGDAAAIRAGVSISRHVLALDDATVRLAAGRLFAPLPVREIALAGVSVRFRDGLCESAGGSVRAEVSAGGGVVALPGSFTGTPRCDAGAVLLPLTSAGGEQLTLRLLGAGRYHAEIALRPGDPAAAARLLASGFAPGPDGTTTLAIDGGW